MSEPCPHCGGTKTDPVPKTRTLVYFWARHLGYEVRQCGRCRELRWLRPEDHRRRAEQSGATRVDAAAHAASTTAMATSAELQSHSARTDLVADKDSPPGTALLSGDKRRDGSCPTCGCSVYRRSHRTPLERFLLRGPMARCKECGRRFPLPEERHRIQGGAHA
jgi:hypothetical protein